mmetsp:Transcript_16259/g.19859  ORF Transcript_16259/g.19859 Transcript_16259/m.19859 type:complete len:117 (+) Transcript_16259:86-436(+)
MGYDNHVKTRYFWSSDKPYDIQRASHCIIDDVATLSSLQRGFAHLSVEPSSDFDPETIPPLVQRSYDAGCQLQCVPRPFPDEDVIQIRFIPPPKGTRIGLTLLDDEMFNLLFLIIF